MNSRTQRYKDASAKSRASRQAFNVAVSLAARDIGDIPPVKNHRRKKESLKDFRKFCENYFPKRFSLEWSDDHIVAIDLIQRTVLNNESFAQALPRGSGKTSLAECAVIWAVLNGYHEVVALIAASDDHATTILSNIKAEFEHNELLMEDFPEVCYPIRRLEGEARRCVGQLHHGMHTHIEWSSDSIRLPTIPGSLASANIIRVSGITGAIRGMSFTRPDGRKVRPTFVMIDDPQTDESAKSLSQCAAREAIINGAIKGLAGPGNKVAIIIPCTVIRKGDVADTFTNRLKYPEYHGIKGKLLRAFPKNLTLWQKYWDARSSDMMSGGDGSSATTFYVQHRTEMDEGADVSWKERKTKDDVSAIQHAMNLYLSNPQAFMSEYQNEPMEDVIVSDVLTADEIASKLEGTPRQTVPLRCTHLTLFIDVQKEVLPWAVTAWDDDFGGTVIDYGAWPDQKREYFRVRDVGITLSTTFPQAGLEGRIYSGLDYLCKELFGKEYKREDGAVLRIERGLIDANWGDSTDTVYEFCRHAGLAVMPSHGRFVGASGKPFSEWHKTVGDRVGLNWRIPKVSGRRMLRHVLFDTNFWKSFIHARFAVSRGDAGCLSVFGKDPRTHRLFSEHLTAEFKVRTEGRGRVVDEWKLRPDGFDNHWLDCLVGCAVAASMLGVKLSMPQPGTKGSPTVALVGKGRKRLTAEELARAYRCHGQ